ncbi:hypothetical protein EVAR_39289_1 [Eumeta japonica]|uniref:Uncharacterized protein n=1 Tax=Eumeta variegata TaxID=151549 RepID=A0A4C1VY14_EUMVA|nr:hypothetical protein EVAR_39289_1 [Eumeta japonica]
MKIRSYVDALYFALFQESAYLLASLVTAATRPYKVTFSGSRPTGERVRSIDPHSAGRGERPAHDETEKKSVFIPLSVCESLNAMCCNGGMGRPQVQVGTPRVWRGQGVVRALRTHMATRHSTVQQCPPRGVASPKSVTNIENITSVHGRCKSDVVIKYTNRNYHLFNQQHTSRKA